MHCRVGNDDEFRGLFQMKCAFNWCNSCPIFDMHPTERTLMTNQQLPFISIHTYDTVYTCSEHGVLSGDVKTCTICDCKRHGEKRGKTYGNKKLVSKSVSFADFFDNYYIKALKQFKQHLFLVIMLSNNHASLLRENIQPTDVWSSRDFAERLTLMFNKQAQHEYFTGGSTISLEGVAIKFFQPGCTDKRMEFHTYLSDGKTQDSSIVNNHMEKLLVFLKERGILKEGSVLYCHTDGCR